MRQQYEIRADVTAVERDFRRAWYRVAWASSIEDEDRPLHVSPFLGAYGRCGLVLAINGTPPAGLLLWNAQTQRVYMLGTLRVKTIAALTVLAGLVTALVLSFVLEDDTPTEEPAQLTLAPGPDDGTVPQSDLQGEPAPDFSYGRLLDPDGAEVEATDAH